MSNNSPKRVGNDGTVFKCPLCRNVLPTSAVNTFPFCSERCRLLDLNNWLTGRYTVSRPIDPTDNLDDIPKSAPEAKNPPPAPGEQ